MDRSNRIGIIVALAGIAICAGVAFATIKVMPRNDGSNASLGPLGQDVASGEVQAQPSAAAAEAIERGPGSEFPRYKLDKR